MFAVLTLSVCSSLQVPDSIHAEYQSYRGQYLQTGEQKTLIPQDDQRQQLERLLELPSAERVRTLNLSMTASTILEIIKSGNPPVKFEAIRKSRKWGEEKPIGATINGGINELISLEIIDGDNENGYTLTG